MPLLTADYSNLNHEEMAASIGLKAKHVPMLIASFMEESVSIMEELKNSISAKDYDKIKSDAHAIKGSAGNLRLNEVYEMAKEMEFAAADSNEEFNYDSYLEAIQTALDTISI